MSLNDEKTTEERIRQTLGVGHGRTAQRRESAAVEVVVRIHGQVDCMVSQLGPLKAQKDLAKRVQLLGSYGRDRPVSQKWQQEVLAVSERQRRAIGA